MKRLVLTLACALLCLTSARCKKDPAAVASEKVMNLYIWSQYMPQSYKRKGFCLYRNQQQVRSLKGAHCNGSQIGSGIKYDVIVVVSDFSDTLSDRREFSQSEFHICVR